MGCEFLARLCAHNAADDCLAPECGRTCATDMAELGIPPHIIEVALNHISGHKAGVAGIYNRAEHSAERKAALELWAAHVEALVTGRSAKVLAFKGAR
jgi:hypothetical protein